MEWGWPRCTGRFVEVAGDKGPRARDGCDWDKGICMAGV